MSGDDDNRKRSSQWPSPERPYQAKEEDMKVWGILLFGFVGATATTLAVSSFPLFSFVNVNPICNSLAADGN